MRRAVLLCLLAAACDEKPRLAAVDAGSLHEGPEWAERTLASHCKSSPVSSNLP